MLPLTIKIPNNDLFNNIDDVYSAMEIRNVSVRTNLEKCVKRCRNFIEECYRHGFYILNYCVERDNYFAVQYLLELKEVREKIEQTDEEGRTPLKLAVFNKNSTMAKLLIYNNAKITGDVLPSIFKLKDW